MFESTVKAVQRDLYVAQVRGIVCYFANHLKLLVTYGDIASALGGTPRGGQLAQALGAITEDDHKAGKPPSTAVVVGKHTGKPGTGFFVQCRQLGFPVGPSEGDENAFWLSVLNRLKVAPLTLEGATEAEEPDPERGSDESEEDWVARTKRHQKFHTREVGMVDKDSPQVSLNVKKKPLDDPDTPEALRARLAQADKAGWTGPTKVEKEEPEPVGHSQLPGAD